MKKTLAILLSLALIMCMIPVSVYADTSASAITFDPSHDTYTLYSVADLLALDNAVTGGNTFEGKTIYLDGASGSYDMSNENSWDGIGNSLNQFRGTIIGLNCRISGMRAPLVYTMTGATIKNITFTVVGKITTPVVAHSISDIKEHKDEITSSNSYTLVYASSSNLASTPTDWNPKVSAGLYTTDNNIIYSQVTATDIFSSTTDYYAKTTVPAVPAKDVDYSSTVSGITIEAGTGGEIENTSKHIGALVGTVSNMVSTEGNPTTFYGCTNKVKVTGAIAGGFVGKASGKITFDSCTSSGTVTGYAGAVLGSLVGEATAITTSALKDYSNSSIPAIGKWLGANNLKNCSLYKPTTIDGFIFTDSSTIIDTVNVPDSGSFMINYGKTSKVIIDDTADVTAKYGAQIGNVYSKNSTSSIRRGELTLSADSTSKITSATADKIKFSAASSDCIGTIYVNSAENIGSVTGYAPATIYKYGTAFTATEITDIYKNGTGSTTSNREPWIYTAKYAAKIGNIGYSSLGEAISAAKNGETIILQQDLSSIGAIYIGGKSITINLNSYDIRFTAESFNVASGAKLTIDDRSTEYYAGQVTGNSPSYIETTVNNKKTYNFAIKGGKFNFIDAAGFNIYNHVIPTSTCTYNRTYGYYYVKNEMKIAGCDAMLGITSYIYDGKAKIPTVTLYDGDYRLVENIDYTVGYSNNVNAGYRAAVTIYGKGSYSGSNTIYFTITPKYITGTTVDSIDNQGYTGVQVRPDISVKDGLTTLYNGTDYTLSYGTNINVGSGSVTVTGKGNYTGSRTLSFKIAKNINNCTFSSVGNYNYTGYSIRPSVTVTEGGTTLRSGTDYKVTYGTNTYAGEGTVTITGAGIYGGSKTITFRILGEEQKVTARWNSFSKLLTSSTFNLGAKALGNAKLYYTSLNPSIAAVDANGNVTIKDTGIAQIRISSIAIGAYGPDEKIVTVKIRPNKAKFYAVKPAKRQLKVRITKQQGATKYQIKWATNKSFRSSKNYYVTHSTNTAYVTQAKTLKTLRSGSVYYIKVRAYKTMPDGTKVWGTWSDVRAYRVK